MTFKARCRPRSFGSGTAAKFLAPQRRLGSLAHKSAVESRLSRARFRESVARNHNLYFRPSPGPAPYLECRPNSLRPLAHSQQSPVRIASRSCHLGVDAAPIVAHNHAQPARAILDLRLNAGRFGMEQCIDQRFSPDQINLLLDVGPQYLRGSGHTNFASHAVGRKVIHKTGKFPLDTLWRETRRPEPLQNSAAFFEHPAN